MKARNVYVLLILSLLPLMVLSQEEIPQIDPALTEKPWLDKETKDIGEYTVTLEFGEQDSKYRHMNFGPITGIAYYSYEDLIEQTDSIALAREWDYDKGYEKKKFLDEYAKGGAIDIYITRYEESRANFKWFFIIIRDSAEKKLKEIQLGYQSPQMPEGNGWWNYKRVYLMKSPGFPFYVYLNDKLSDHLSDFKFSVNRIKK